MYRFDKGCGLLALALAASIAHGPEAAGAQTPGAQAPAQAPPAASIARSPEEEGDALMAQKRYQAAIEAYKKGDRSSAVLGNKLGIAYQLLGNTGEALRCYLTSLKADPRNATVLNNLGTVYDSQKQYGAAQKMYKKALKIEPKSAVVFKNLGTAYMAQHKYRQGAEAYREALALDPKIFEDSGSPRVDNPAASKDRGAMNFYMAESCARAGQNGRAIQYLRMALNEGFTTPGKIMADESFAGLRGLPAFEELMAAQK